MKKALFALILSLASLDARAAGRGLEVALYGAGHLFDFAGYSRLLHTAGDLMVLRQVTKIVEKRPSEVAQGVRGFCLELTGGTDAEAIKAAMKEVRPVGRLAFEELPSCD